MKTVLVTGASGGIGNAIAYKFAINGHRVVAQYNKNKGGIDSLISKLESEGVKDAVFSVQTDLLDIKSIDKMMQDVLFRYGGVDVLVNNAGVGLYKLITETTEKEWDDIFALNMKSAYYITNKALDYMIEKKCGKIVNVSSMWGIVGASMEVAYSASKSALIGYTKALAKELAPSNINVNCVCPGVIDTPMNASFSEQDLFALKEQTPLGRLGTPQDVAELVYFLSQECSSFITGQVISCDGGFIL